MSQKVEIRVKSKGNKIGASTLSRLNKMGNPTEILKKINEIAKDQPTKKVTLEIEGLASNQKINVLYPGDAQVISHLLSQNKGSLEQLNNFRRKYEKASISAQEYQGILKSINEK